MAFHILWERIVDQHHADYLDWFRNRLNQRIPFEPCRLFGGEVFCW